MTGDDRKAEEAAGEDSECWLCDCGDWIEDGFHCPSCGAEPPWGCPGECCQGGGDEAEYDGDDAWDFDWERP